MRRELSEESAKEGEIPSDARTSAQMCTLWETGGFEKALSLPLGAPWQRVTAE